MKKFKKNRENRPKHEKGLPNRERSVGTDEGGEGGTSGNWGGGATAGSSRVGPPAPKPSRYVH
jgi:hypothetical protein